MSCDVENCEIPSRYSFPEAGGTELCRWHSYLFRKAAESEDELICIKLLEKLPEEIYQKAAGLRRQA